MRSVGVLRSVATVDKGSHGLGGRSALQTRLMKERRV